MATFTQFVKYFWNQWRNNGRYRKTSSSFRGGTARKSNQAITDRTALQARTYAAYTVSNGAIQPAQAIEDAGIRPGEITGYRCWWVTDKNTLRSLFLTSYEWPTDEPAWGEVAFGYGIHAFKTVEDLVSYNLPILDWYHNFKKNSKNCSYSVNDLSDPILVYGAVSLWGDIIEHERGYRAQYAKVKWLNTTSKDLLKNYGVYHDDHGG